MNRKVSRISLEAALLESKRRQGRQAAASAGMGVRKAAEACFVVQAMERGD